MVMMVVVIAVGQWLVSGLQHPSSARQSLAARQKELSEEHRMTLKRQKCIENKQNLCNFPFFLISFSSFSYFSFFFFLLFSIFLSPSARQRWTAQQNGPSIEGPEGPRPKPMLLGLPSLLLGLLNLFSGPVWVLTFIHPPNFPSSGMLDT